MTVTYCPVCDERTVHNRVRPTKTYGTRLCCREHVDIDARIDAGDLELVEA